VADELDYPEQLQAICAAAFAAGDWNEDWTISLEQIKRDIVRSSRELLADQGTTG
jgi:P2-related tail formation protein